MDRITAFRIVVSRWAGQTPQRVADVRLSALGIALLITGLGIAFGIKLALMRGYLALGLDPANYLVTMNGIFGGDPTGLGLARPPLIAFPMKLFTQLFGVLLGIKVLGAVAAVAMGIPFYLLARRHASPYAAAICSILFVFSSGYSSMLVWGFLSLIGFFFILLTLYFLLRLLEERSKTNVLLTAFAASLLVGFHQVSFVILLLFSAILIPLYFVSDLTLLRPRLKSLIAAGLAGTVLSLPYLPSYLLSASQATSNVGPILHVESVSQVIGQLAYFFPDHPLTALLVACAAVGAALLWRRDRAYTAFMLVCLLLPVPLLFVEPASSAALTVIRRLPYFMYVPLWLFISVAFSAAFSPDFRLPGFGVMGGANAGLVLSSAAVGIISVLQVPAAQTRLQGALAFYNYLDAPQWHAVQWVRDNTQPTEQLIAHTKIFGWWLEGAARRNVFETLDVPSFYRVQQEQSFIATLTFSYGFGVENGALQLTVPASTKPETQGPLLRAYDGSQFQDVFNVQEVRVGDPSSSGGTPVAWPPSTLTGQGPEVTSQGSADGITVARRFGLSQGGANGYVTYDFKGAAAGFQSVVVIDLSEGDAVQVQQSGPLEVVKTQAIPSFRGTESIQTTITADVSGGEAEIVQAPDNPEELLVTVKASAPEAVLTLKMASPASGTYAGVVSPFSAEQMLQANQISYVAIDTKTNSPLFQNISPIVLKWMSEAPYLTRVFQDGDVVIYKVRASS